MNRYDEYIKEFLVNNGQLSLSRIGTFNVAFSEHKNKKLHPDNVQFFYNRNASTSPDLIDFSAQKLSRNRSLVSSDFDSYLQQVVQFLNIGKAHTFRGICTIKKNKQGSYELLPDNSITVSDTLENSSADMLQSKSASSSGGGGIKVFALLICLAILGALTWGGYQYFSAQKQVSKITITADDTSAGNALDTAGKLTGIVTDDSTALNDSLRDSSSSRTITSGSDSGYYRFIYEETVSRLRANTRTLQLRSYGYDARFDSLNNNSIVKKYEMYIRYPARLNDTSGFKDSLETLFQKTVTVRPE